MDDSRLTDAALEREIESALAVDPSPEFLARVRARVADEAQTHPSTPWRLWHLMAAGAAAAVVVAMLVVTRGGGDTTTVPPRPAASSPVVIARVPQVEVPIAPPRARPVRASRPARAVAPGKNEPEVLIAAGEAAAIRRLILGVGQGRVDMPQLTAAAPDATPLPPVSEIAIQPVIIEPLASSAGEQGVRQ